MACRGVHFAITDEDLSALRSAGTDDALIEFVQEVIEQRWEKDAGFVCETDKAWDAIHRCLTDGNLGFDNGTKPLRSCILGGERLGTAEDYIVSLVLHKDLRTLADALSGVSHEFLERRYKELPNDYDMEKSKEDFEYTWDWFSELPAFFDRAEKAGRHVIFTVDQ